MCRLFEIMIDLDHVIIFCFLGIFYMCTTLFHNNKSVLVLSVQQKTDFNFVIYDI